MRGLAALLAAAIAFGPAAAAPSGPPLEPVSAAPVLGAGPGPTEGVLRVCADPNNMPFSNRAGEGFENKLAELVADRLGWDLRYTWWAQRRGFIRNTLKAGECDAIMGVAMLDMLSVTRRYYRSGYVFVTRADSGLDLRSIDDPALEDLVIGVHLIGDDGSNTPPAHALGERGVVDQVRGYPIYGDYREDSPPSRLIRAVAEGEVDVAAAWGPLAGYYAARSATPLEITPIEAGPQYLPLVFQYAIGIGVRREDKAFRDRLDEILLEERDEIDALLARYHVPRF